MLAITQFEVYVLQKGRWTLHARYPGEERREAVADAHTVETRTGFPSKVIRETYFPDVNDSERFTIYTSPKIKEAEANRLRAKPRRRSPMTAVRAAANTIARRRPMPVNVRPRLTPAQVFFRIIVTGAVSLLAATILTVVVNWSLSRFSAAGVEISPNMRSATLTYAYVAIFLFFFYSLVRSRLPLHRLLADLWNKATPKLELPEQAAGAAPPRVKPKHDRPPSPETLREIDEMKVKRGDLDLAKPQELEATAPAVVVKMPESVPSPANDDAEKQAAEKQAKAEAKRKKKAEAEAAAQVAAERAAAAKTAAAEAAIAAEDAEEVPAESLNLERMVLRRFASDVVAPALKTNLPDDPVTRRAAAIVLAGGAAGVAATARLNARAEASLLRDALQHMGMNSAVIESFMSQRTEHLTTPANAPLLAAGRNALAAYLQGSGHVVTTLSHAMAAARSPFHQTHTPLFERAASGDMVPLLDVYVLTELREDHLPAQETAAQESAQEQAHDLAMGTHNGIVRAAIAAHGGHEVKHTGKGIFARFATAQTAVNAAIEMQTNFTGNAAGLAVGVIGNTVAGEDPILSADLVRQAQAIVAQAVTGQIVCEPQVQAAIEQQNDAEEAQAGAGPVDTTTSAPADDIFSAMPATEPSFETVKIAPANTVRAS